MAIQFECCPFVSERLPLRTRASREIGRERSESSPSMRAGKRRACQSGSDVLRDLQSGYGAGVVSHRVVRKRERYFLIHGSTSTWVEALRCLWGRGTRGHLPTIPARVLPAGPGPEGGPNYSAVYAAMPRGARDRSGRGRRRSGCRTGRGRSLHSPAAGRWCPAGTALRDSGPVLLRTRNMEMNHPAGPLRAV